ncbi:HpcH/HpaI aldolase/citrate lyase family protein [Blastococcus sp. LR1]|uniref:HpcH/HpaI aldolase/citrate lyase family protein n=1 Tax=Blastococcus sp. LR1 TaxID=2877000 RepID=UPI001CCF4C5B|nr:HpcH/HpaI aldolase/citrate lyase family protein [Blastococcus sp. LR1]MCA0146921.1 HpcH/HpaI aldolase/citrate lyase family protein [Blastococcus sp. LR1]
MFDARTDRRTLAVALGATLYTPGTRQDYAARIGHLVNEGVASAVLCLEDAIRDDEVLAAERNVVTQLRTLHGSDEELPQLFVRVRHPDQVRTLVAQLGPAAAVLTGFVFPKFTAAVAEGYLTALAEARAATALPLYGMPVLETGEVLFAETRLPELLRLRDLLAEHEDSVLAVRIGATDLCGLYGLRRGRDLTIWDLALVREALADIVNVFARDDRFTVTGAVWEHFTGTQRLFKPQLRQTPFGRPDLPGAPELRGDLIRHDLDGLMREVVLDKATGIVGKTVIHPSHVRPVHALYVVTHEELEDARTTLQMTGGGVTGNVGATRMIESRPHARWATHTLRRASVFGALHEDRTFVDLLHVDEGQA